jgi:hypothetical protein
MASLAQCASNNASSASSVIAATIFSASLFMFRQLPWSLKGGSARKRPSCDALLMYSWFTLSSVR